VADRVVGPEATAVAYLHDTLEDTYLTDTDLLEAGFSEEVVEAVRALTRKDGETYFDFILRVQLNPLAVKVKVADLEDNMSDLHEGSLKDKYRLAHFVLTGGRYE